MSRLRPASQGPLQGLYPSTHELDPVKFPSSSLVGATGWHPPQDSLHTAATLAPHPDLTLDPGLLLHIHLLLPPLQVWQTEKQDFEDLADAEAYPSPGPAAPHIGHTQAAKILRKSALQHFWPRLVATCVAWMANDFA